MNQRPWRAAAASRIDRGMLDEIVSLQRKHADRTHREFDPYERGLPAARPPALLTLAHFDDQQAVLEEGNQPPP